MAKPKLRTWAAAAGVAWAAGFVYNVHLGGEAHWLKSMYQKKVAIAAQIDEPKLLVTGGSGAHYTLNSALLEDELDMPVVNLGIDGPVGLGVILPTVLEQVNPGDTVLLIPEYLILHHENGLGERSGPFSIAIGRPGIGNIPAKQLAQDWLMLGVPSLRGVIKSASDLVNEGKLTGYYDDPLTANGDPTVDKIRVGDWWKLNISKPATDHAIERIAQFQAEVEAKGGTLILSLPWTYAELNDETKANILETADALDDIAPLIYDKDTLNIQSDVSLFADTHYHLTAEGRTVRSQQLAAELKPLLTP
ncbi:MAG: hypothetical protein AAFQ61_08270 [Cyanobacteria bacterium J06626_23]